MKKGFSLVIAGLFLASCGGGVATSDPGSAQIRADDSKEGGSAEMAGEVKAQEVPGATACVLFAGDGPDGRFAREDEPLLVSAFEAAGLPHKIINAKDDVEKFNSLANELISGTCFVLFMSSPDSSTGVGVIAKAQERGLPVVDYENLTLGGGADYHLGFDLVSVGVTQGQALINCLPPKVRKPKVVYLNGSPTDVNATLLKLGYASVLEGAEGKKAGVVIIDDQSVPDWVDANVADIVRLVWGRAEGKVDGLIAADDNIAIAAVESLPKSNSRLAVVGQGATIAGLQALVDGRLCASVYKPVRDLAAGAVEVAVAIRDRGLYETDDTLTDIATNVPIAAKLIPARKLGPSDVKEVLSQAGISVIEVCSGQRQTACEQLGIV